jgi:hypothetical protein
MPLSSCQPMFHAVLVYTLLAGTPRRFKHASSSREQKNGEVLVCSYHSWLPSYTQLALSKITVKCWYVLITAGSYHTQAGSTTGLCLCQVERLLEVRAYRSIVATTGTWY